MSDFSSIMPCPSVLCTASEIFGDGRISDSQGVHTSTLTWPAANRVWYVPIWVPSTCTVVKMGVRTVSTGTGGNFRLGIYDSQQNLIFRHGADVAHQGTNAIQTIDITDTVLHGPALYYLAMVDSGNVDTYFGCNLLFGTGARAIGAANQNLANTTLPSPAATFTTVSTAVVPTIWLFLNTAV